MSTDVPIDVVVDALAAGNLEYVLIGGAAMMLHGCAYTTDDVDIFYRRELRASLCLWQHSRHSNPV